MSHHCQSLEKPSIYEDEDVRAILDSDSSSDNEEEGQVTETTKVDNDLNIHSNSLTTTKSKIDSSMAIPSNKESCLSSDDAENKEGSKEVAILKKSQTGHRRSTSTHVDRSRSEHYNRNHPSPVLPPLKRKMEKEEDQDEPLCKIIQQRSQLVPASNVSSSWKLKDKWYPRRTYYHQPKVGALCIHHDGYSISDGKTTVSEDLSTMSTSDGRWIHYLLEDLDRMGFQKILLVDGLTARKYETLVPRPRVAAARNPTEFGCFFRGPEAAQRHRTVQELHEKLLRPCQYCGEMKCHRWRVIEYGMKYLYNYPIDHVPH